MNVADLAQHYSKLSDGELLYLARDFDQLTQDAQLALEAELQARGLAAQGRVEKLRGPNSKRVRDRGPRHFTVWIPWGIGYMNVGKANRRKYAGSKAQEYTTTTFFLLFWFPLIPVKSYRVLEHGWKLEWLERLPLDWRQVRRVWGTILGCILAVIVLVAGIVAGVTIFREM